MWFYMSYLNVFVMEPSDAQEELLTREEPYARVEYNEAPEPHLPLERWYFEPGPIYVGY